MTDQLSRSLRTTRSDRISEWSADKSLACLIVFLLPIRTPVTGWLTYGLVLAILIMPIMIRSFSRNHIGQVFLSLAALSILSGWLTRESIDSNGPFISISMQLVLYQVGLIIALALSVLVAVWACQVVGIRILLLAWSIGLIVHLSLIGVFSSENPWKYGLALPVSLIMTILATRHGRMHLSVALIVLSGISVAYSYRSWLAIIAVAFSYIIVMGRTNQDSPNIRKRRNPLLVGSLFSIAIYGMYLLLIQLMTSGSLGEYVKERTLRQERLAGSAIIGGRPEWGSAIGLARENPFGFGLGVMPTQAEVSTAIRALPVGGRSSQDVSNVATALRGGEFSFHSTFWNFWANYGIGGAVLIAFIVCTLAVLIVRIRDYVDDVGVMLPTIILFLGCMWDLFFSPSPISLIAVGMAVAVHLIKEVNIETQESKYTSPKKGAMK